MTICIAVRGVNYEGGPGVDPVTHQSIIAICDRMLSYPDITVDDAVFKRFKIHPRWRAMFSGNDLGPLTPMMRFVEDRLATREGDLEEVADVFRNAFHNHSHLLAVDTVLGKYGHTLSSWREEGRAEFGEEEFARINRQIEQIEIGIQFLVFGFSPVGQAHIFTVQQLWTRAGQLQIETDHHNVDGFALIGSGTTAALGSLVRTALPVTERLKLIYRICEAKMLAERAPGVGKGTVLSVLECRAPKFHVGEKYVVPDWDSFRAIWLAEAQPPTPPNAMDMLSRAYDRAVDWDEIRRRNTKE